MQILKVEHGSTLWTELADYAESCSWIAGKHLAELLRNDCFTAWEAPFVVLSDGAIIGFCTFLQTDYYPENRYSPWISSIFVEEAHRGKRISQRMIEAVIEYARTQGFSTVYIPSDMTGFYEKYGFVKIDELQNYGGDTDNIFAKNI